MLLVSSVRNIFVNQLPMQFVEIGFAFAGKNGDSRIGPMFEGG
jgi:hypothetical protein